MVGHEPYATHRDRINVRGVLLPSQESGCDEPSRGVHKRTALGCTFDTPAAEAPEWADRARLHPPEETDDSPEEN